MIMRKYLKPTKRFFIFSLIVLSTSLGFVSETGGPSDNYFEISKNLDIFGKLYREVNAYYVDDVDPSKFMRTGIDAMLKGLDPYTTFISASEIEDYRFMSTGQYGGIGAMIGKRDGKIIVTEPYEDYPAAKAGMRAGDEIIQIDDEKMADHDVVNLDVRDLLRGQPKSKVKLKVKREGVKEILEFELERAEVKIKNVPYYGMANDDIGYITLTGFTRDAAKEVRRAYESLKSENPNLKGVILDLRDNPGGLLFEAVDIANLFVKQGEVIVETRGKIEGSVNVYKAKNAPVDTEMPIAVVVNRRSASASEIVSGVIQDLDRGVIIGQRSFGKGLVQTTRPLSYNTQLKITTAKYYTPSGRCIQAIDYSNRNEDGSVGKIPDSLKHEFKTRNGRTVYDGGGVEPDFNVNLPKPHSVTKELLKQNLIFDYCTDYRAKHEAIPPAGEFKITDAIYQEFKGYVRGRGFKFTTKTEEELKELKEMLEDENYLDDLHVEIEHIEDKLQKEKENDLDNFRNEIAPLLRKQILNRYYYRKGEIEGSFTGDPDIKEAIRVLQDKAAYEASLKGE